MDANTQIFPHVRMMKKSWSERGEKKDLFVMGDATDKYKVMQHLIQEIIIVFIGLLAFRYQKML